MTITDLDDLVGARGPRLHYGRALLFVCALVCASVVTQTVYPFFAGGHPDWRFFRAFMLAQLASGIAGAVLVGVLAVLLLRFVSDVFTAIVMLAALDAPLARGLTLLTLSAGGVATAPGPEWSLLYWPALVLSAVWPLCFMGGLALALRSIPRLVPALLVGAVGGEVVGVVVRSALLVALHRSAEVGHTLRALPWSVTHALVFALVSGLGLLLFSARPKDHGSTAESRLNP